MHHRRRETQYESATPLRPKGYGGVGPSPALALLPDTHSIASSRRLGSSPTALVTRPAVVVQQPSTRLLNGSAWECIPTEAA